MSMSSSDAEGLKVPATYAAAWGVREQPAKGPKRGLGLEQVVAAGVEVASADGLAAVSMSRVASELGLSAMALYRYVKSKDELLDLMVDSALGAAVLGVSIDEDSHWRTKLENWIWAELAAYREHPWALGVTVNGPPLAPNHVRWLELGLRCMSGLNIEAYEKISIVMLLTSYTRSWAALSGDLQAAFESADPEAITKLTQYGQLLRLLANRADFPALFEVIDTGIFEEEDDDPDYDFRFGLARLLDGIEALVRSRQ